MRHPPSSKASPKRGPLRQGRRWAHPEVESEVRRKVGAGFERAVYICAHVREAPRAAGCASRLPAACWARTCPGGPRAPAPTRAVPVTAHGRGARLGGPRAPRPPPLPLLQTFSQLPDLLRSAPRSASLMNYSAARAPISAPRPPRRAPAAGGGSSPAPRAPPSPARRRPAQSQPGPAPARPAPRRSLPPSRSVPARLPSSWPARSALGPAARAAPLLGGGETASGRPTPSQPGRDPEAPEGPRLQARPALRPLRAASAKTPPARPRARRGRGATPGRRCRERPHGPALRAPTGSPTRGVGVCTLGGGPDLGGLVPPKLGSDPTRESRRHGAPGSALLGFARRGFGR